MPVSAYTFQPYDLNVFQMQSVAGGDVAGFRGIRRASESCKNACNSQSFAQCRWKVENVS